jgi:hypothetical protein
MVAQDVAVGFLYHAGSGKVLLHLRSSEKWPVPQATSRKMEEARASPLSYAEWASSG